MEAIARPWVKEMGGTPGTPPTTLVLAVPLQAAKAGGVSTTVAAALPLLSLDRQCRSLKGDMPPPARVCSSLVAGHLLTDPRVWKGF